MRATMRLMDEARSYTTPNEVQGRCAALSRSGPWNDGSDLATGMKPTCLALRLDSERRRRIATDDCRRFADELVICQGSDHEEREIHAAGKVAFENGIPNMPAPNGQALSLSLFEITPANDRPLRVAGEYSSTRFDLVVKFREAQESGKSASVFDERSDLP